MIYNPRNMFSFIVMYNLSGVVVSVLATGPKVAGSNPAEEDGF
jgi:hypothetical protein